MSLGWPGTSTRGERREEQRRRERVIEDGRDRPRRSPSCASSAAPCLPRRSARPSGDEARELHGEAPGADARKSASSAASAPTTSRPVPAPGPRLARAVGCSRSAGCRGRGGRRPRCGASAPSARGRPRPGRQRRHPALEGEDAMRWLQPGSARRRGRRAPNPPLRDRRRRGGRPPSRASSRARPTPGDDPSTRWRSSRVALRAGEHRDPFDQGWRRTSTSRTSTSRTVATAPPRAPTSSPRCAPEAHDDGGSSRSIASTRRPHQQRVQLRRSAIHAACPGGWRPRERGIGNGLGAGSCGSPGPARSPSQIIVRRVRTDIVIPHFSPPRRRPRTGKRFAGENRRFSVPHRSAMEFRSRQSRPRAARAQRADSSSSPLVRRRRSCHPTPGACAGSSTIQFDAEERCDPPPLVTFSDPGECPLVPHGAPVRRRQLGSPISSMKRFEDGK